MHGMCYVSFAFFFPCFSAHVLSDAIVNSLAFHRSVLAPQLLLYYVLIIGKKCETRAVGEGDSRYDDM